VFQTILVPVALSDIDKATPMLDAARQLGGENARVVLMSVVENVPTYVATELPAASWTRPSKMHMICSPRLRAMQVCKLKSSCAAVSPPRVL